jgi:hypothetical protein
MLAPIAAVAAVGCGVLFAPVAHADPWELDQCQNLSANIQNYAREGRDVTSLKQLYTEKCGWTAPLIGSPPNGPDAGVPMSPGGSPGAPNGPAPAPMSPNGPGVGPGVAPASPGTPNCVPGGPCSSKGRTNQPGSTPNGSNGN